jgi:hypothetical protein
MGHRVASTVGHRTGAGRLAVLGVAAALALGAPTAAFAGPPLPPDGPVTDESSTVPLGAAMEGDVAGLRVEVDNSDDWFGWEETMVLELEVHNDTGALVQLEIEPGTLLEPAQEGEQTVVPAGPVQDVGYDRQAGGGTPTLTLDPGSSVHQIEAYCGQETDWGASGPFTYGGVAAEPLPTVMREISAQDPDGYTAQEAVWWVTDRPVVPVPTDVAPLLADVDTVAFAAEPQQVVPEEGYTPQWDGGPSPEQLFGPDSFEVDPIFGQSDPAGPGLPDWSGLLVMAVAAAALLGGLTVAHRRSRSTPPAAIPVSTGPSTPGGGTPPGWYADPWRMGSARWWDGRTWSNHVR